MDGLPTDVTAPASATPAGWYPDPVVGHGLRYWDGIAWTDHVADDSPVEVEILPPAGWYDDPMGLAPLRWWDGERWTDDTSQPAEPAFAPEPALVAEPLPIPVAAAPVEGWILSASGIAMVGGSILTGAKGADAWVFVILGLLVGAAGLGLAKGKGRPNRRDIIVLLVAVVAAGLYGLAEVLG